MLPYASQSFDSHGAYLYDGNSSLVGLLLQSPRLSVFYLELTVTNDHSGSRQQSSTCNYDMPYS